MAKQLIAAAFWINSSLAFVELTLLKLHFLRVSSDILIRCDAVECSVLLMLDLTCAFDTVDHHILLDGLRHWVGISGSAADWFAYYLCE